ncbi:hypothetical protein LXN10_01020 [Arcobacter sp. KX21116]|uniref:DUF6765 family protein n=1 Tax=Arcobacter iocasae TaxID=2906515 RepID=UPI0035D4B040
MQIDGHHTLTYVLSRMVGFEHREANIIAHAAQYVDDATNSGNIEFTNGAMFSRISSAHTMEVYDMKYYLNAHENHLVWVPFHFLPGNDGKHSGEYVAGSFIRKLICKPYSPVADDILDACINDLDKPYSLHRLGITMHVFADTFAHQGFAGVVHNVNKVKNLECHNYDMDFFDSLKSKALSRKFPMGHGPALTCPDMPFLKWSYTNGLGENVNRDNLEIFMSACNNLIGQLGRYLVDNGGVMKDTLPSDIEQIKKNFETFRSDDENVRHDKWLSSISNGEFSFGPVDLEYIGKGEGSWKHKSINQIHSVDQEEDVFEFSDEFMDSDWRLFHVALKAHRFDLINNILPKYGMCVS